MISSIKLSMFFIPFSNSRINLENVAGAVTSPNGITRNWKSPLDVWNAVFGLDNSVSGTCQFPYDKSILENTLWLASLEKISSAFGIGSASNLEHALIALKSQHKTEMNCLSSLPKPLENNKKCLKNQWCSVQAFSLLSHLQHLSLKMVLHTT